jgi:hypothetical protein
MYSSHRISIHYVHLVHARLVSLRIPADRLWAPPFPGYRRFFAPTITLSVFPVSLISSLLGVLLGQLTSAGAGFIPYFSSTKHYQLGVSYTRSPPYWSLFFRLPWLGCCRWQPSLQLCCTFGGFWFHFFIFLGFGRIYFPFSVSSRLFLHLFLFSLSFGHIFLSQFLLLFLLVSLIPSPLRLPPVHLALSLRS